MRRRHHVLAAAALALLLAGCHQQTGKAAVQDLTTSPTARDGGQVQVVASGFTPMPAPHGTTGPGPVSVAVELRNTSKNQQAQQTHVEIGLFDPAGTLLFGAKNSAGEGTLTFSPVIEPGGTASIGFKLQADDATGKGGKPARMQITVGTSDWVLPNRKPALTTSGVTFVKQAGGGTLDFTAQAPALGSWAQQQAPRISVIFRDGGGKLIGGYAYGRETLTAWAAGPNPRHIQLDAAQMAAAVPPGADLTRTEVQAAVDGG